MFYHLDIFLNTQYFILAVQDGVDASRWKQSDVRPDRLLHNRSVLMNYPI